MNRQTGVEEAAALQALRDVPEAIRGKNVLCEGCVRWMRLTCREQELWNVLYRASFGHQAIVRGDFQHVVCLLKEAGGMETEKEGWKLKREGIRKKQKGTSHAGNRTRIGRVRACYPNRLDYMGPVSDLRRGFIRAHPPLHQRLKLRPITHSSAATKTTKRKKRKQYCYKSSSTRDPRTHSSPSTTFSKSWSSSTCDCATSASIRSASSSTELSRSASTASSVS